MILLILLLLAITNGLFSIKCILDNDLLPAAISAFSSGVACTVFITGVLFT